MLTAASQSTYWMPRSGNEPAIGAVILPRVCLQMTITGSHPLGQDAIRATCSRCVRLGVRLDYSWVARYSQTMALAT